jgi:hypothetical protein
MFGKLFGKKQADQSPGAIQEKLSGPKEILQPIGQTLVISHKLEPDWVWNLKTVTRSYTDNPNQIEFRVYEGSQVSAHGISVKDFHSLDAHPQLVLYNGWLNKKTKELDLVDNRAVREKAV